MMLPGDYFGLHQCAHQELFQPDAPAWTALGRLQSYLASFYRESRPLVGRTGMVCKLPIIVDG